MQLPFSSRKHLKSSKLLFSNNGNPTHFDVKPHFSFVSFHVKSNVQADRHETDHYNNTYGCDPIKDPNPASGLGTAEILAFLFAGFALTIGFFAYLSHSKKKHKKHKN